MAHSLSGQVVIITGASSGIGRTVALALAGRGVCLVLAARRVSLLEEVASEARAMGSRALVVPTDVTDTAQVTNMVRAAHHEFGRIDVLINNAGFGQLSSIEDTTPAEMKAIMDVNYFGTFNATSAVLDVMKGQGSGHIINISSVAGTRGLPLMGAYSVTKAAQKSLAEALRVELAEHGIHVSVVYPTVTRTEFFEAMINKTTSTFDAPAFFTQTAEHVARAIVKCIERPRAEVLPFPLMRMLMVLNAVSPGVVDFVLRRYYKKFLK